ncbi:hypothetical protein JCM10212_000975 [Sporobolomyces blumeae]
MVLKSGLGGSLALAGELIERRLGDAVDSCMIEVYGNVAKVGGPRFLEDREAEYALSPNLLPLVSLHLGLPIILSLDGRPPLVSYLPRSRLPLDVIHPGTISGTVDPPPAPGLAAHVRVLPDATSSFRAFVAEDISPTTSLPLVSLDDISAPRIQLSSLLSPSTRPRSPTVPPLEHASKRRRTGAASLPKPRSTSQREAELIRSKAKLARDRTEFDQAMTEGRKELADERKEIRRERIDLERRLESLERRETKVERREAKVARRKKELEGREKDLKEGEKDLEATRHDKDSVSDLVRQVEELEVEVDGLAPEVDRLAGEVDRLEAQVVDLLVRNSALVAQNSELSRRCDGPVASTGSDQSLPLSPPPSPTSSRSMSLAPTSPVVVVGPSLPAASSRPAEDSSMPTEPALLQGHGLATIQVGARKAFGIDDAVLGNDGTLLFQTGLASLPPTLLYNIKPESVLDDDGRPTPGVIGCSKKALDTSLGPNKLCLRQSPGQRDGLRFGYVLNYVFEHCKCKTHSLNVWSTESGIER